MAEIGLQLLSWWITLGLHALILLGSVWLAERGGLLRSPSVRQASWRLALLAPLLTASVHLAGGREPWGLRIELPTPMVTVASQAAPAVVSARDPVDLLAIESAANAAPPVVVVRGKGELPTSPVVSAHAAAGDWRRFGASALVAMAWLWSLLVVAAGLRVLLCWRRERKRSLALVEVAAIDVRTEVSQLAHLARLPAVRVAADPLLAGPAALAPATVCLPPWAVGLEPRQRRAMLAHEVAHLSRRDPYWLLVYALLRPLPFAAVASRRLTELAEHACDAWAVRQTGGGRALAESLALCVERGFTGQAAGAFASPMAQARSPLVERVQRLIEDNPMSFERIPLLRRVALAAALVVALLAMPGVSLIDNPLFAETAAERSTTMPPIPPEPPQPPEPPAPPAAPATPPSVPPPPSPPSPPSPPTPPKPPENLSVETRDGFFGRSTRIHIEDSERELSFEVDGKFAFNEGYDDLATLDDEATLIEERGGVKRRIDFERDGDSIERVYSVDGDERPLDADARRWLAATMLQVLRESGIDAEKRVNRIHRAGGASAVLAEIGQIGSDHARGQYLLALFALGALSDGELDVALKLMAGMQSDYNKRTLLIAALETQTLAAPRQASLLGIAAGFVSGYELRMVLVAAVARLADDAAVHKAWFDALASCDSDYEQRVALEALLQRGQLGADVLQRTIAATTRIESDYERRTVLQAAAPLVGSVPALALGYLKAVQAMGSDYERRVALESLIAATAPTSETAAAVLDVVDQLASDYERGEVMMALAAKMPADAALIARYRTSARSLGDHTRGQVERALDRFQS